MRILPSTNYLLALTKIVYDFSTPIIRVSLILTILFSFNLLAFSQTANDFHKMIKSLNKQLIKNKIEGADAEYYQIESSQTGRQRLNIYKNDKKEEYLSIIFDWQDIDFHATQYVFERDNYSYFPFIKKREHPFETELIVNGVAQETDSKSYTSIKLKNSDCSRIARQLGEILISVKEEEVAEIQKKSNNKIVPSQKPDSCIINVDTQPLFREEQTHLNSKRRLIQEMIADSRGLGFTYFEVEFIIDSDGRGHIIDYKGYSSLIAASGMGKLIEHFITYWYWIPATKDDKNVPYFVTLNNWKDFLLPIE